MAEQSAGPTAAEDPNGQAMQGGSLPPVPGEAAGTSTRKCSGSQLAGIERPIYVFTREAAADAEMASR